MANRAKKANRMNHERQMEYLSKGVVMLPTKAEVIREILRKNGVKGT